MKKHQKKPVVSEIITTFAPNMQKSDKILNGILFLLVVVLLAICVGSITGQMQTDKKTNTEYVRDSK